MSIRESRTSPAEAPQRKIVGRPFEKGHPQYPPRMNVTAHQRLVKRITRELKREYGPDITAKNMEHIRNIAAIRARLQLQGEAINNADYVLLVNTERRELECL